LEKISLVLYVVKVQSLVGSFELDFLVNPVELKELKELNGKTCHHSHIVSEHSCIQALQSLQKVETDEEQREKGVAVVAVGVDAVVKGYDRGEDHSQE